MERTIETYDVPVYADEKGVLHIEENKRVISNIPAEKVNIETSADIQRLAVEISQENSRQKDLAEMLVSPGKSSSIQLKYLI